MRGMHCGGDKRGVAPFYRVGEAGRCGARNDRRWRCAIKAPVTRRGDDGAAAVHEEIEEDATTHLFLFSLGTGGR
jgi:hypothetical protein